MGSSAAALSDDLAMLLDPARFAERAGIMPDAWQAQLLRSTARQAILCCSRQAGKSTVTSVLAAHQATYAPHSLTLILAPSQRQAIELLRKVKETMTALGQAVEQATDESATRLEFANGSRVVALPGKEATIRGFSGADLLIEDEASRVSDALYAAIRPMLAVSGGRLVLLSTPWGKRGHFYEAWEHGGGAWERYQVPATACPRILPAWLEQERRALPDFMFRQEYLCEFLDTDDQYFATDLVAAALTASVTPLWQRVKETL